MSDDDYLPPNLRVGHMRYHVLRASHAVADSVMNDLINYVEQAQYIVGESDRRGASILYSMGQRLLQRCEALTQESPHEG